MGGVTLPAPGAAAPAENARGRDRLREADKPQGREDVMRRLLVALAARALGALAPAAAQDAQGFSQPRDPYRGAVPGRRAGRYHRAHHRAEDERGLGPAGDHRQPPRRQHRVGAHRRQGHARRLHAADGDQFHAGDEPVPLQEPALRSVQRLRADHQHDQDHVGAGGVRAKSRNRPPITPGVIGLNAGHMLPSFGLLRGLKPLSAIEPALEAKKA